MCTNLNKPCPKCVSYSKTGPAPVWLDIENYNSAFYLVTLSEELDCGRKNGEQRMYNEPPKIIIRRIEECEDSFNFWNRGIK